MPNIVLKKDSQNLVVSTHAKHTPVEIPEKPAEKTIK
jgi:hypothetical protein